jgi:2-polyprenyl-3-methyl-5-hydroxy-6-metoxy-1,4-benzoquinol methylase
MNDLRLELRSDRVDKMKDVKKCYLCGCQEFNKKPGSVRDNSDLEIWGCASCGLVFLSSFDHIKESFYESSKMHGEEMLCIETWLKETEWDDERRFQYLKSALTNCRLLDFGCGAGGFLLKARRLAETAHGIELEASLSNHYYESGLTVYQHLYDIPDDIRGRKYNIITLFHVLEHIPDPRAILEELSEMLTDTGQIIVEVPNANDALLTLYKCESFSNFTYWSCHLFLYTATTLQMLFNQMNLKVNYIKQIQRYSLANHLHWLANNLPNGHQKWHFLDSQELQAAYESSLSSIGKCDTIIGSFAK